MIFWILGISQESANFSFHAGIEVTADNVRSPKLNGHPFFWNYGLVSEFTLNQKWIIHLNISHSIRNYEERKDGLLTGSDILNGTTSYYSSLVEEKLVEIENLLKYQFLDKKLSPFLGLGYAIQFPYSVIGERKLVHSDGTVENLSSPGELTSKSNFGIYSVAGVSYSVIEKLNITFDFGYKLYFGSNLTTYGFPHVNEAPNRHNSLIFSLGILYKLK